MGVTLSSLRLRGFPKNVGPDFGSEGADSEEVSGSPSEEAELLEQPSEGMSGEGLEWKEHAVALGAAGRDWNRKSFEASLELGGSQSLRDAEGVQGRSRQNSETASEWKTGHPLTMSTSRISIKEIHEHTAQLPYTRTRDTSGLGSSHEMGG